MISSNLLLSIGLAIVVLCLCYISGPFPTIFLYLAGFLSFCIGVAHSFLGEKFILIRLFKRGNLPKLFGTEEYTKNVLRYAWHITTIAWFGFGYILIMYAKNQFVEKVEILGVIMITFGVTGLTMLIGVSGQHYSYIVFFMIVISIWFNV